MSALRSPFAWTVRRELWENRSLRVAPLAAAALALVGNALFILCRAGRAPLPPAADPVQRLAMPYSLGASLIMLTAIVTAAFYCADALHGERRDRSILFWKSLPVSDLQAVLAKACIPLVVMPAFALVLCVAAWLGMYVGSLLLLPLPGVRETTPPGFPPLAEMTLVAVYGLAVHALWHAPLYAWLLLVSAWARRTPLVWSVMPFVVLAAFEHVALRTSLVGALVRHRLAGAMTIAFAVPKGGGSTIRLAQLDPLPFLASPGLWLGLAAAALFLFAAVRLRRRGEPL